MFEDSDKVSHFWVGCHIHIHNTHSLFSFCWRSTPCLLHRNRWLLLDFWWTYW